MHFGYVNITTGKRIRARAAAAVWMIKPAAQLTTAQVVAKQNRFAQMVVMLCAVRWNFEGIINHFELV